MSLDISECDFERRGIAFWIHHYLTSGDGEKEDHEQEDAGLQRKTRSGFRAGKDGDNNRFGHRYPLGFGWSGCDQFLAEELHHAAQQRIDHLPGQLGKRGWGKGSKGEV